MALKRFVFRGFVFCIIAFSLLSIESFYTYFTKSYEYDVTGNELYLSLRKSIIRKKVKVLVFGDSVAKQLYDNETYNGDVYSLACNQAVSLAGHYILLKRFIETNRHSLPESIILLMAPESFSNNLNQVYTFHYFVKPFFKKEFKNMLTKTCKSQVRKIPLYFLSQMPFILNSNWSPSYQADMDTSYHFISPISNDYLLQIKELCVSYHLHLKIFCPPLKISMRELDLNFSRNVDEIERSGFKQEFADYFKKFVFLPDSLYQDHLHFKKQYIPTDYFQLASIQ